MTHFIMNPADPDDVVQDDRDFGICSRCGDRLREAGVATDDELFCLECADELEDEGLEEKGK